MPRGRTKPSLREGKPDAASTSTGSSAIAASDSRASPGFDPTSSWLIPSRIELLERDSDLFVLAYTNVPPHPRVEVAPELLDAFVRLESAPDEAILAFARRCGPLWLCKDHDYLLGHDPECETFRYFEDVSEEELERADQPGEREKFHYARAWFEEALAGWGTVSAEMRATLRIARRLHDGILADDRDWDGLGFLRHVLLRLIVPGLNEPLAATEDHTDVGELEERSGLRLEDMKALVRLEFEDNPLPEERPPNGPEHFVDEVFWEAYYRLCEAIGRHQMRGSLEFQRKVLGEVLNQWLTLAGVRPRLEWGGRNPQMHLGGDGLIGALAVQLFFACAQTGGLALCASCGTPFLPAGRRRRKDLNAYCSDCGLKAALRDAAARYRQTQKYRATNTKWRERRTRDAKR